MLTGIVKHTLAYSEFASLVYSRRTCLGVCLSNVYSSFTFKRTPFKGLFFNLIPKLPG